MHTLHDTIPQSQARKSIKIESEKKKRKKKTHRSKENEKIQAKVQGRAITKSMLPTKPKDRMNVLPSGWMGFCSPNYPTIPYIKVQKQLTPATTSNKYYIIEWVVFSK